MVNGVPVDTMVNGVLVDTMVNGVQEDLYGVLVLHMAVMSHSGMAMEAMDAVMELEASGIGNWDSVPAPNVPLNRTFSP